MAALSRANPGVSSAFLFFSATRLGPECYRQDCDGVLLTYKLQPVGYRDLGPLWGIVCTQYTLYKSRLKNIDELKWRLIDVWHGLQQTIIDSAVKE